MLKGKKGQAIFEILPSTMVFAVCIFSSLIYYRYLREQQLRHEAIRNIVFAKINNSGPLTTVPEDYGESTLGFEWKFTSGQVVNKTHNCFVARAENSTATRSSYTPWLKLKDSGGNQMLPMNVDVRGVIYRRPGSSCN